MRKPLRLVFIAAMAVSAGRVWAQGYDAVPAASPPPPKGVPAKELPKTNPAKAPSDTRKAVRVPKGETGPIPPGKAGGEALLQIARASYEQGNFPLALEQLEASEKLRPNSADAWNLRGAVLLKQEKWDAAAEAFRRAVNLDPSLWAAKFNVAEVPFRRRDYGNARRAFEDLSFQTDRYRLEVEWELLQYKIVVCSLLAGDEPGAQKRFGRLKPTGTTPAYFYAQAAFAFAKKDAGAAKKFLEMGDAAAKPQVRAIFSDTLVRAGWVAGGSPSGSPAGNYDPTAGQSAGPKGRGLPVPQLPPAIDTDLPRSSGEIVPSDAIPPASEPPMPGVSPAPAPSPAAPVKAPAKPEAEPPLIPPPLATPRPGRVGTVTPGWIFVRPSRPSPRFTGSQLRAAANDPDGYTAKLREAQAKLKAKDFDAASKLLEEAIPLTENPSEVQNLRGAIEFYRGNYPAAEALFRKAQVADPSSWPARFNLAEIAFAKKDYPAARSQYEAMLPDTDTIKQPVEREMLQFKIFLALLQEDGVEMAERMAERLPMAGQTPARYYAQVALEARRKRFDKAAEVLASAERFYATSLNFLFAQPLEKLGVLPLPDAGAGARPVEGVPSPAPATANATPAPARPAEVTPLPPGQPGTEAQLLDEIMGGRAVSAPGTPRPKAAIPSAPPAVVPIAPLEPASAAPADAPHNWLADLLRWLVPGSNPRRLDLVLFALGAANLLAMLWLLASGLLARLLRPRSLSLHTAGSVGVAVNKVRNIERLRVRLTVANMTNRAQTIGQMDVVMAGAGDWNRTFHWRTICLNPSGSAAAFEEMEVYPLVLLPGEVASLYVDFVADANDAPARWAKGRFQISVLGWTESGAGRAKPDFSVAFPLEIPSIPWRNQDFIVDLAIGKGGKDGRHEPRDAFLDDEALAAVAEANGGSSDEASFAPPGAREEVPVEEGESTSPQQGGAPAPMFARTPKREFERGPELPLFGGADSEAAREEFSAARPPRPTPPGRPLPPISRDERRPPATTLVPIPPAAASPPDTAGRPADPPPPPRIIPRSAIQSRQRR